MQHVTSAEAQAVIEHIVASSPGSVTVAVCDAGGDLVALYRGDGAAGFTAEIAAAKAYTSARFGNSTSVLEELWSERPVYAHSLVAQGKWFVGRGGVPLRRGDLVVGAVGVSGSDPAHEEALAVEAAESVR